MNQKRLNASLHYGWVIVGVAMLAVFGCIGLGRLALGMLLPSMGTDLGLSYAQMGMISAGNFAGYQGAVFFCGWLVRRFGSRTVIACGLLAVGASMILISRTSHYPMILALYVLTGMLAAPVPPTCRSWGWWPTGSRPAVGVAPGAC